MLDTRATFSMTVLFTAICAILATIVFGLIFGLSAAQEKTIKIVPVRYTNPSSAKEMYDAYCAVCHGVDGKGDGPAAFAFETPPTDLTMLAKNNGGKYPSAHVLSTLRFGTNVPAHGTLEMPIWAGLFRSVDHDYSTPEIRMRSLLDYIREMQAK